MSELENFVAAYTADQNRMAAKQNAYANVGVNADEYAQKRATAASLGVPIPETQDSWEMLKARKAAADVDRYAEVPIVRDMLASQDLSKLIANSPADWEHMSLASQVASSWKQGRLQAKANNIVRTLEISSRKSQAERDEEQWLEKWADRADSPLTQKAKERLAAAKKEREDMRRYAAADLVANQFEQGRLPVNTSLRAVTEADSVWDMLAITAAHPFDVIGGTTVSSTATNPWAMAATIPAGILTGGVGAAAVQGASSFESEYGSTFLNLLSERGVDLTDASAVQKAFSDPKLVNEVSQMATLRALTVGGADALSVGMGKLVVQPVTALKSLRKARKAAEKGASAYDVGLAAGKDFKVARKGGFGTFEDWASQAAIQAGMGAGGEAAGNIVIGKDVSMSDVFLEAVAELGSAPNDVIAARGKYVREKQNAKSAETTIAKGNTATSIMDNMGSTELSKRAPEVAAQQVQQLADSADMSNVTVNARESFDTLEKLKAVVPTQTAELISKAQAEGSDINVPMGDIFRLRLQDPVAGDELLLNGRYGSEGMTFAEAKSYDADGSMQKAVDDVLQVTAKTYADRAEKAKQAAEVLAPIRNELKKTGLTDEQVDASLQAYATVAQATADMFGVSLKEYIDSFGVTVKAEGRTLAIAPKQDEAKPAEAPKSRLKTYEAKDARTTWGEEARGYRATRDAADTRVYELRNVRKELQEQIPELEKRVKELQDVIARRGRERKNNKVGKELAAKQAEYEAAVKRLQDTNDEIAKLNAEREEANAALLEVENKLRLQAEADAARNDAKRSAEVDAETFDAMAAEARKAKEAALAKVEELTAKFNEAKARHAEMIAAAEPLKRNRVRGEMEAKVDAANSEMGELITKRLELETKIDELTAKVEQTHAALEKARRDAAAFSQEESFYDDEGLGHQLDLEAAQKRIKGMEAREEVVESRLADAEHGDGLHAKELSDTARTAMAANAEISGAYAAATKLASDMGSAYTAAFEAGEQAADAAKLADDLEESESIYRLYLDDAKAEYEKFLNEHADVVDKYIAAQGEAHGIVTGNVKWRKKQKAEADAFQRNVVDNAELALMEAKMVADQQAQEEAEAIQSRDASLAAARQADQTYAESETLLYQEAPLPEEERVLQMADDIRKKRAEDWRKLTPEQRRAYNKQQAERRKKVLGAYDSANGLVKLFTDEGINASTFVHEMGHHWLNVTTRAVIPLLERVLDSNGKNLSSGQEKLVNLIGGFFKWGGLWDGSTGMQGLYDAVLEWSDRDINGQRELQEKFARGMESYLASGKAPTKSLALLFGRFAEWMKEIYMGVARSVGLEKLSPEVAQLYDQLFVSKEAVEDARQRFGDAGVYDDLIAKGMTEDDFRQFVDLRDVAVAQAEAVVRHEMDKGLQLGTNAEVRKVKGYDAEYKKMVKAALESLNSDPNIRAVREFTKTHVTETGQRVTTKIRIDSIGNLSEEDQKFLRERGVAIDSKAKKYEFHTLGEMAMALGCSSPEDLVARLRKGFDTDEMKLANDIATEKFREKYDVAYSPEGVSQLARKALANEARLTVLSTEVAALKGAMGQQTKIKAAAVEFAKDKISRMQVATKDASVRWAIPSVSDLRSCAARAGRNAMRVFGEGKTAEAADAKQAQLVHECMAAQLEKAQDRVTSFTKRMRTAVKSTAIDGAFKEQIAQIAAHLRKGKFAPNAPRISDFLHDNPELYALWESMSKKTRELLDSETDAIDGRELTYGQVDEIHKLVSAIAEAGTLVHRKKVTDKRNAMTKDLTAMNASLVAARKARRDKPKDLAVTETRSFQKAVNSFKGFLYDHLPAVSFCQLLDGNRQGAITQRLVWRADECGNKEVDMSQDFGGRLSELLSFIGDWDSNNKFVVVNGTRMNLHNMFSVVLNMGNEQNAERLETGNGFTREVQMAIASQLTADQLERVNGIWALFEELRKEAAVVYRRTTGTEPQWVKATPFTVRSADGKEVQMTGGYVPIRYDNALSKARLGLEFSDQDQLTATELQKGIVSTMTANTYTKERAAEAPKGMVIRLDTQSICDGFEQVVHDVCWREFLADTKKLYDGFTTVDENDNTVAVPGLLETVRQYYGDNGVKVMTDWVKNIATGGRPLNTTAADRAMALVRQGVSLAGLGFNFMTAIVQCTGLMTALTRVPLRHLLSGVGDITANPAGTWKGINTKSSFMRRRTVTRTREIADVRTAISHGGRWSHVKSNMYDLAYAPMMAVQGVVDHVVWGGAYRDALAKGFNENDAVKYADRVVADTQGSGLVKDSSMMENGGAIQRVFMVFYAFMGRAVGLNAMSLLGEADPGKRWAQIITITMVTPMIESLIRGGLEQGGDDEERKWARMSAQEKWTAGAAKVLGASSNFLLGQFFLGREMGSMVENYLNGDPVYTWRGPSGLRAVSDLGQFLAQAQQKKFDAALAKSMINLAGDLGLPGAAQINRSIAGWDAIEHNKTDSWMAYVFGYKK